MRRAQFDRLVSRALDDLPAQFAERLKNIVVIVEARPSREIARELGGDILGLYQGASEFEQSPMAAYALPEVIVVYQQNIEAICRSEEEIIEEVRKTVIHEIGHHFGLSDEQMETLESEPNGGA
jgi:predicted Zn-dependent protease with MMP-like domain